METMMILKFTLASKLKTSSISVASGDTADLAELFAQLGWSDNRLSEVIVMAAEKLHDADWRTKNAIDTF